MLFAGEDGQPPPGLAGRAPAPKGGRQLQGTGPGCCGHTGWRSGPVDFPEGGGIMARCKSSWVEVSVSGYISTHFISGVLISA